MKPENLLFRENLVWDYPKKHGSVEQIDPSEVNSFDHYRASVQEIFCKRGGFVTPSGAGKIIIILHIGNEDGFLNSVIWSLI